MAQGSSGWVSFTPASLAQLPEEQRREVERRGARHEEERGRLLAVVEVRVFEHDEDAQVTFPPGAGLGPDSDAAAIAAAVARARDQLAGWR